MPDDPVLSLIPHRRRVKGTDYRLAAVLRVVGNGLVYGNSDRSDEVQRRENRRWILSERPGPWNFLPIASSTAAGARLLLAVLDRQVSDLGGVVAYRDTDSALIPSTPEGGTLTLDNGATVRALSRAEVDTILAGFANLSPCPDWPVWKVIREKDGRPLSAIVFGPKRHAAFVSDQLDQPGPDAAKEVDLIEGTEAGLGGTYVDPPTLPGRVTSVDGHRRWSMAAVLREIEYVQSRRTDRQRAVRPEAPWDVGQPQRFPALRRYLVKTPEMAHALPACLGARPGTRYVVGEVDEMYRSTMPTPVALDPGGDLSDWPELTWVNRATGERLRVTTDPMATGLLSGDTDVVLLTTLSAKGVGWAARPRSEHVEAVEVDPLFVRRVGRVSGVFDALDEDRPGGLEDYRPQYQKCACGCDAPLGREHGTHYLNDEHRRDARNRRRRKPQEVRTCACGCGVRLSDKRKSFLDATHRERAKKRRQRAKGRQ